MCGGYGDIFSILGTELVVEQGGLISGPVLGV